jgi:hypothetical protein
MLSRCFIVRLTDSNSSPGEAKPDVWKEISIEQPQLQSHARSRDDVGSGSPFRAATVLQASRRSVDWLDASLPDRRRWEIRTFLRLVHPPPLKLRRTDTTAVRFPFRAATVLQASRRSVELVGRVLAGSKALDGSHVPAAGPSSSAEAPEDGHNHGPFSGGSGRERAGVGCARKNWHRPGAFPIIGVPDT